MDEIRGSNDYISRKEHDEFSARINVEIKRMEDENDRQNHRINDLEEGDKQITNLAMSVQELASSVKSIAKETERLGNMMEKNIKSINDRIEVLENADGEKWRKTIAYIDTTIIGILIGFLFKQFGIW